MSDDVSILVFLWMIMCAIVGWGSHRDGKKDMVNELCNIKVYDFCQQDDTTYKLKEFKE